ncbi:MAG: hypothetical protein ACR2JJ_03005, partial [Sphingomicrobium sp.]
KEGVLMIKSRLLRAAFVGAAMLAPLSAAVAQVPGSEIVGQTLQVQAQGVTNSVYLAPDGTAQITTPQGMTVPATWSAANNQFCIAAGGNTECVPYSQPFQPGQQVALTSSCQQVLTLLATSTNQPVQQPTGERG